MINADMRLYNFYTIGAADAYGQPQESAEPQGTIKAAIYITSQVIQDNVNYKGANYVALTQEPITDAYIIQYGEEKLKVCYVQPKGRYKQAFLVKQ